MFGLTFLGTAAAVPSSERGLPAVLLEHGPHRFLVDCGEGTQRQLLQSGLGFRRLDKVFLTHVHADHILGLPGLIATLAQWEAAPRLDIHAGPATLRTVRALVDGLWPNGVAGIDVRFVAVETGRVWEGGDLRVDAFPLRHRGTECFGYRFEEMRPVHRLDGARLDALGVPSGPMRSRLAAGETIVLADGRHVRPGDVAGAPRPGLKVAVLGDTVFFPDLVRAVAGCDLLVTEATFTAEDAGRAAAAGHMTATEAATLALEAGVRSLWLTHVSHRTTGEAVAAEARAVFADARVASDFDRVQVSSEQR
ncbi:MAG TPA: ribonuclease Z [Azospirillaceae bacterium]|nr:ribonuclease Z [Azospirillaceae bacterium]